MNKSLQSRKSIQQSTTPKKAETVKVPSHPDHKMFIGFKLPKHLQHKISLIQLYQIQQAYILYCDQDKRLSREKICPLLRSLGLVVSNLALTQMKNQFGFDTHVNLQKLLEIYAVMREVRGDPDELDDILLALSGDKGELDIAQLKKDMMTLGDPITDKQFEEVMKTVGNRHGKVKIDLLKQVLLTKYK